MQQRSDTDSVGPAAVAVAQEGISSFLGGRCSRQRSFAAAPYGCVSQDGGAGQRRDVSVGCWQPYDFSSGA